MKLKFWMLLTAVLVIILSVYAETPLYLDKSAPIEKRVEDLITRMTLEEKALMISGDTTHFDSRPNERLGIPALRMTDGPLGVRWGESVAFPAGVCLAATWNPDLVYEYGKAVAQETKAKGRNVILGPCVNIHRTPFAGRNFESYGEDPFLASAITSSFVKGVQSENVIATVKHYACNNQEFERHSIDAKVDERTLHEIYFPAYKAAVDAECWAVMAAYNRINGHYACSNVYLLNNILRDEWGFKGFVMSDWGAVHSVVPTLYAGMDIEMPTDRYLTLENTVKAIREGRMKETKLDAKVRGMLLAMMETGIFDGKLDEGATDTPEHRDLALEIARQGFVLLKNENHVLPFTSDKIKSIAVIGPHANVARTGGGGSSHVTPTRSISPLQGLQDRGGNQFELRFSQGLYMDMEYPAVPSSALRTLDGKNGLKGDYYSELGWNGEPTISRVDTTLNFFWDNASPKGIPDNHYSVRWTGQLIAPETSTYTLALTSDDGSRLYVNGELVIDNWGQHGMVTQTGRVDLREGEPASIRIDYYEESGQAGLRFGWKKSSADPVDAAVETARNADAALVFVGSTAQVETEGRDRETLGLPDGHAELVQKISSVNPKTVVVLTAGASVTMKDWIDDVAGLILNWFPGQEGGYAIADLVYGNVNPSGKLVTTFFKEWQDCPAFGNYPGENDAETYEEGIFVGYRGLDNKEIEPQFAFGHGLSYTTFEYSGMHCSGYIAKPGEPVTVSFDVKNTGNRAGAEIAQVYVGDVEASVPRPMKELKAFKRIVLNAGETKTIELTLDPKELAFWDFCTRDWKIEPGQFKIYVGSSSSDIRLTGEFTLQ